MYTPVFRNALPELFNVFDFPPTSMVTGQRSESTVPTQALFLLDDPWVREQAEATQRRILKRFPAREPASSEAWTDSIPFAYRLTLGRSPSPAETRTLQRHLATADPSSAGPTRCRRCWPAEFRLLN